MQQDLVVAKKLGDTAGRLKNANRENMNVIWVKDIFIGWI